MYPLCSIAIDSKNMEKKTHTLKSKQKKLQEKHQHKTKKSSLTQK
jgi:hypothetical protein